MRRIAGVLRLSHARRQLSLGQRHRMFSCGNVAIPTTSTISTMSPNAIFSSPQTSAHLPDVALFPPGDVLDEVVVRAGFLPVESAEKLLTAVQEMSGLPWWGTIVASTLAVRLLLLPLAITAMRNSTRMRGMQPELQALQATASTDTPDGRVKYAEQYKALQNKHGVRLHRTFLPIFGQMPVFLTFFFTLTEMGLHCPSMVDGGTLWFTDLTIPDATYGLPVLTSLTFLGVVEAGGEEGMQAHEQAKMMKNVMRGMSFLMVPLTMGQPVAVFVYWITTNVFSLTQTMTLKLPAVKAALGVTPIVNAAAAAGEPMTIPTAAVQMTPLQQSTVLSAAAGKVSAEQNEDVNKNVPSSESFEGEISRPKQPRVRRKRRRRKR